MAQTVNRQFTICWMEVFFHPFTVIKTNIKEHLFDIFIIFALWPAHAVPRTFGI